MQRLEMGVEAPYMRRMRRMIERRPFEHLVVSPQCGAFRGQSLVLTTNRVRPAVSHRFIVPPAGPAKVQARARGPNAQEEDSKRTSPYLHRGYNQASESTIMIM